MINFEITRRDGHFPSWLFIAQIQCRSGKFERKPYNSELAPAPNSALLWI
ncbi:hypothetical protein [Ruminococcus bicirculans (ex Wegman et al. 2014)]